MSVPSPVRGLLVHVSHYDPVWWDAKGEEKPFDVAVGCEIVDAMADAGMNLLVVDCADGVKYKSHPELERHYSVPMSDLVKLAEHAHARGVDVAPKLNFAKSGRNLHDAWMGEVADCRRWTNVIERYYEVAADCIAEVVEACRPKRFFHVGMDEDHHRSHAQYVDAIKRLRKIVKSHRLRTIVWNDSCHDSVRALAQVHADKCRDAEQHLPKDIVQVLWDYEHAHPRIVKRLRDEGFEVWAAPGRGLDKVRAWKRTRPDGWLLTAWVKCARPNRDRLLDLVRTLGRKL